MGPSLTRPEALREYAFLADGERGALVGPHGDIVWMCAPRWHSDGVFSALLGGQGCYLVTPTDPWYVWGGYYEEGSLIWRSRWSTTDGAVECREALAMPGDPHTAVVLRRVEAVDRDAAVTVRLDPRAGFGEHRLRALRRTDDGWSGRVGDLHVRWTGLPSATRVEGGLETELVVPAGGTLDLVLEISDQPLPAAPPDARRSWDATEQQWAARVPGLSGIVGARDARHAYAVLAGLTSSSGGMAAAATTSLPERARTGRDYDYRYAWIRDQSYVGQAIATHGAHPLLDDALRFVTDRVLADGPALRPAYTVDGGRVPGTRPLPDLPGYPGGKALVGNRIDQQFQLDTFGEVLLLLAAGAHHDRLDTDHWRAVETMVAAIQQRGDEPGAGIWEIDNQRWTHSRLICAAGLRAVAGCAPARQAAEWVSVADRIVARTAEDSVHPSGRWQRSPTDPSVDAALLLPTIRGALPRNDPRSTATYRAVLDELVRDEYVYRFRHDDRRLSDAEGAFLLCGFLTALAMHQQGDTVAARGFYERSRAACGPPGLYAEEYDVVQRQLRGNLPQAFVHALMFEASVRLSRSPDHVQEPGAAFDLGKEPAT